MIIRLKNGMDYFLLKSEGKNYLLTDKRENGFLFRTLENALQEGNRSL